MNYLKKPGILILTSFVVACGLAGCGGSASEPIVDTPVTPEPEVSSNLECDAVAYPCSLAEVPQDVLQASEDVSSEILTRLQAGDDSQAVVDWLSSLTDVVDASGDDLAITFRLNGGRPVWIFRAKSLAQNVESVNAPGAAATPHIPLSLAAMIDAVESLPSSGSSAAQSTSASAHQAIIRKVVGQSATEKSALILSPFKHQFGNFDEGTSLVQILQATRG